MIREASAVKARSAKRLAVKRKPALQLAAAPLINTCMKMHDLVNSEKEYVLYVGKKPVQRYADVHTAKQALDMIRAKFPDKFFAIVVKNCEERRVAETRIHNPKLVNVFFKPNPHSDHARRVAEKIPTGTLDFLIKAMCKKFGVKPTDFIWSPVDEPYGQRLDLDELIQPEIVQQKGFTKTHTDELGLIWTAHSNGRFDLTIDVQSPQLGQIAYITLEVNPDEDTMSSQDTYVDKRYRRMGIATKMYNWAEELGNTVVASSTLSKMGKKFWKNRVTGK